MATGAKDDGGGVADKTGSTGVWVSRERVGNGILAELDMGRVLVIILGREGGVGSSLFP